jgi:hypothetical protein
MAYTLQTLICMLYWLLVQAGSASSGLHGTDADRTFVTTQSSSRAAG